MRRVRVAVTVMVEMDIDDHVSADTALMLAEGVIESMAEDSGRMDDGWVPEEDGAIEAAEVVSDTTLTHGWVVHCGVTGNVVKRYGFEDDAAFAAGQCGPGTPHTFRALAV